MDSINLRKILVTLLPIFVPSDDPSQIWFVLELRNEMLRQDSPVLAEEFLPFPIFLLADFVQIENLLFEHLIEMSPSTNLLQRLLIGFGQLRSVQKV